MSLLVLLYTQATAQINLVPNPSFEEYIQCPNGYPDLDGNLKYWKSFKGTPDLYTKCSSVCGYNNQTGFQEAKTGNSYVGFLNFDNAIPNGREQLGVKLTQQLVIGEKYYISIFVSCAYNIHLTNIASSKMGVKFTNYDYSDPNLQIPLSNFSHLSSNVIVKDTLNWVKIFGSFIADSSYNFIVIGGFYDDNNIDTINLPYDIALQASYYYLDDICVSNDSTICSFQSYSCDFALPTAFSPNGDNINDTFKWITSCNRYNEFVMNIYNRWGEKVFTSNDSNYAWDGYYKGIEQPSDVYAVHVAVVVDGKHISKISNLTLFR